MEAKRRALDGIATRQREAQEGSRMARAGCGGLRAGGGSVIASCAPFPTSGARRAQPPVFPLEIGEAFEKLIPRAASGTIEPRTPRRQLNAYQR